MESLSANLAAVLCALFLCALLFPGVESIIQTITVTGWVRRLVQELATARTGREAAEIMVQFVPARQTAVILRDTTSDDLTCVGRPNAHGKTRRALFGLESSLLKTSLLSSRFSSDGTLEDSYVMQFRIRGIIMSVFALNPKLLPSAKQLSEITQEIQTALKNDASKSMVERRRVPRNTSTSTQNADRLPISPAQMVTRVAHDLRLPMTNLELTLERIQNEAGDAPSQELAARAVRQLQMLESLTHSVVHVNSGRTQERAGDRLEVDLVQETQTTLDSFRDACAKKELVIELQMPAQLPARCRTTRLRRIFFNLISNAVRYASSPGRIFIRGENKGAFVQWEIQDSGPAIGCSSELFFALSRENLGRTGGGFGIGLASSRDLARESGGDLTGLPSESGARFLLVLPAGPCLGVPGHDPAEEHNRTPVGPFRAL